MLDYRRVGITVKSGLSYKNEAVLKIIGILEHAGVEIFIDNARMSDIPHASTHKAFVDVQEIDLLIVIGGDGTILRSVRELHDFTTPIFSINRGTVGFMAEAELAEADVLLPAILRGEGTVEQRSILRVVAMRGAEELYAGFCLNEAVIAQGTIARLVDLKTTVNDEPLTTFHADGLIIATPTGSTAYSLAAGGPIVHPTLNATILTPINPHSFSQKPVVIPSAHEITVEVIAQTKKFKDTEVVLTLDGQVYVSLQCGDTVRCCGCDQTVKFLRRKQDTFFGTLRRKLKWGEGMAQNDHIIPVLPCSDT